MRKTLLSLTPGMILRRGHYGYFFYYWIYGLIVDYSLAKQSLGQTIFNNIHGAFPVQSITYPYLKALIEQVTFESNDVFIDVGCAWGRLLGYMRSHTKIKRFVGIELNEEVAKCAKRIFCDDPNITIISGSVIGNLPLDGTIFYLFNPFDKVILEHFLDEIEEKIHHPIKLMYLHPTCREVIEVRQHRWMVLEEREIAPKCLGALTLCIYKYNP